MFLQMHTLTSYAAALLNRDDAGLAKRIPFGNADRLRVSSQCLKKHWRDELQKRLDLPFGIRSRMVFEREILKRAVDRGVPREAAEEMVKLMIKELITSKEKSDDGGKASGAKKKEKNPFHLSQPIFIGKPEADYLVKLILDAAETGEGEKALKERMAELRKELKNKNLRALMREAGVNDLAVGVEGAMFGRFVTSDILARSDAAVHVAHALTVHPLQTEVDYFTVVDDLKEELEDAGAAHAGDMELGAGLFYGYVVVDAPLLVSNMTGCDPKEWNQQPAEALADARDILTRLIEVVATVSPGAKLGSTAPYARAALVLLETGPSQPRTLANAYLKALAPNGDPMQKAVDQMGRHLADLDGMYGQSEQRFLASIQSTEAFDGLSPRPLHDASAGALAALFGES
jgi:CRISPR system Cascade subunit CasC